MSAALRIAGALAALLALGGCGKKLQGRYDLTVVKIASTCRSEDLTWRLLPGGKMSIARLETAKDGASLTMTPNLRFEKTADGFSYAKSADLPRYAVNTRMGETGPDWDYLAGNAKVAPSKAHFEVSSTLRPGGEGYVETIVVKVGPCSGACELKMADVDVSGQHIEVFDDLGAPCEATFERRGKHLEEP